MKIIIYTFSLILFTNILLAQKNFEGVIIYHRTGTPAEGFDHVNYDSRIIHGIEKLYFKGNKIKIESEFLGRDSAIFSVGYFDFDKYPNSSLVNYNGKGLKRKAYKKVPFDLVKDSLEKDQILGYTCNKITNISSGGSYLKKYVTDEIRFSLPDKSSYNGYFVTHADDRIPLRIIEKYNTPFSDELLTFKREAVLVFPVDLPDSIFEVDENEVLKTAQDAHK
jgi:hypothetical protein